jgi:hypothetical protein
MDVSGDAIFAGAFTTLGAVQFSSTLTAAAVANFGDGVLSNGLSVAGEVIFSLAFFCQLPKPRH